MQSILSLPAWMPWWVPLIVAVPVLLWGVVFLLMPFSVFGLKARLESVEARLDEIQGEIRGLALRLPEPGLPEPGRPEFARPALSPEDAYGTPPRPRGEPGRPPIPPAPIAVPMQGGAAPRFSGRAEPRLDWPR